MSQESHHLVEAGDFEVQDATVQHQTFDHGFGGVEKFQMDFLFSCPVLQKLEHSHSTAPHRLNLREVKHDYGRVLGHDNVTKLENAIALHEASPALYQHQIIQVLDSYLHHGSPPELDSSFWSLHDPCQMLSLFVFSLIVEKTGLRREFLYVRKAICSKGYYLGHPRNF
jgi:hypothetical protein